eukprot:CAMPEP_0183743914 /NCGR_PEP_ID=MMETSP0737-20130205/65463_1 /TAXON_ID=385413 /ORGANISM="Thalassiosira miniscula, Strain CCMP1093" /LENGTH=1191 /DNA_ID=CAMNT_0025979545 /DNA_START=8 /DNA_END=3583 /DNA_ORIENTATION=-
MAETSWNDQHFESKRPKTDNNNNTHMHTIQHNLQKTGLTEEQRARMEENRRRALEKKQRKSILSLSTSSSVQQDQCPSPNIYNDVQRAQMEQNRRKALEKKQLMSQKPILSNPASTIHCSSHKKIYNDEQRARMEENRRRALEKKQQQQQQTTKLAPDLPKSTIQCASPTVYNNEQRARMEENRKRALEKRQQKQHQLSQGPISIPDPSASATKTSVQFPSQTITYSDEQRARMEENRRKALERRQRQMLQIHPLPSTSFLQKDTIQCTDRSEESDKKHQMSQPFAATVSVSAIQGPSSAQVHDEPSTSVPRKHTEQCPTHTIQCTDRSEESDKKHQMSQPFAATVSVSAIQGPSSAQVHDEPSTSVTRKHTEQCPTHTIQCTDRSEESDKKHQMSEPFAATALVSAIQGPSSAQVHDEPSTSVSRKDTDQCSTHMGKQETEHQISQPLAAMASASSLDISKQHFEHLENGREMDLNCKPEIPHAKSSTQPALQNNTQQSTSPISFEANPHMSQDAKLTSTLVGQNASKPSASGMMSGEALDLEPCHMESTIMTLDKMSNAEENRQSSVENQKQASSPMSPRHDANLKTQALELAGKVPAPSLDALVPHDDSNLILPTKELLSQRSAPASSQLDEPPALSPLKAASIKKSALPKLPPDLHYEESRVLPIIDDDIDTLIENAELDQPLLNTWTLFDHQKEGVTRALRMRRLILAFDMGLGKTIIGCVWAKAFLKTFEGIKIFVIAPVTLHEDWRRTASEATGMKTHPAKKPKPKKKKMKKKKEETRKTVTGKRKKKAKKIESDSEDESEEQPDTYDLYVFSWDKIVSFKDVMKDISGPYVVICDEAHSMQSMTTNRTKEALKLVYPKKCRGVLLLSGTPMKNGKPSNLFPLLKAVKHPFGDHQERYEFFFCNGQYREFRGSRRWDASGSSNLNVLNAHTTSHIFRLTKEECLSKELPPRKREFKKVPIPPRHELRYTQALKDLAEAFSSSHSFGGGGENDEILSSLHRLRQISSLAKVDAIVQLANSILIEESSLVLFTSFVNVAKETYEKLGGMDWVGELLTGETPQQKRQAMVDRFQSGLSPAFVCTYGAGGVGLTLTAACTVILIDRPWTPGDVAQAEDRVRRIGQKRPVRSIWIKAFPIDEQIDELIDHKEVNSNTAVDGKYYVSQNKSAPKIKISELVKSVLSNNKE